MIRVYEVRRREAARMAQLLGVWEASVRATCLFLSEQEIRRLRSYVRRPWRMWTSADR